MSKLTLNPIGSQYGSIDALNDNFAAIEAAFDNTVSRDGASPNHLLADLDVNGKSLLNVGALYLGGIPIEPTTTLTPATISPFEFVATGGQTSFSVAPFTPASSSALLVEVNGVVYPTSSVSVVGSSVTIPACEAGDEVVIRVFTKEIGAASPATATNVSFVQSGAGAVTRSVQAKLRDEVSVKDFGAVCDGVTDDSAAVQLAINACASAGDWKTLVIPGKCRIASTINIDRVVDTKIHDFKIVGEGPGAGFYTNGNVTIFDSTLSVTTDPRSELITFVNIAFESSSVFNTSYVLSRKFLRVKFVNCQFFLIRCVTSTIYAQTLHFIGCHIRNNPVNFMEVAGCYDILFDGCAIYNGSTIVRCIDASRGTNGLRFIGCMIENIYGDSVVRCTGASGFVLHGCHLENNFSPEFNFFAGGIQNKTITFSSNYIFNPAGATVSHGPTDAVFSSGNTVTPNLFHSNVVQVTNLISVADSSPGGISDATVTSNARGIHRSGNSQEAWTHNANHITKSAAGEFAFGRTPVAGVRGYFQGADQSGSNYGLIVADSAGNASLVARNDRQIQLLALGNYANDAAAAGAGIAVGSLYRNGSVVQVRVV